MDPSSAALYQTYHTCEQGDNYLVITQITDRSICDDCLENGANYTEALTYVFNKKGDAVSKSQTVHFVRPTTTSSKSQYIVDTLLRLGTHPKSNTAFNPNDPTTRYVDHLDALTSHSATQNNPQDTRNINPTVTKQPKPRQAHTFFSSLN